MQQNQAKLYVEREFTVAQADQRLFSSFLEHLGRAIYEGIYEPGHPLADEDGFRTDVLKLVRELGVSHVRYPGGNFLSGYNWRDGIGPKEKRPTRLDLAWHTIESNQFGIDEFVDWCKKAGTSVMGAVNMGTGTPKDAGELVEYCNFPGGTALSDLRIENGHKDPHNIKLWCIGNEMDGDWQICHLDAVDYGKKALEAAKIMKWVDPELELVVCGSASTLQKTYPEWDRVVLEHTYEQVDYLSLHRYYENFDNDLDFLASFADMEDFIHTIVSTCDYVKALKRSKKKMMLSFDEWNIWYQRNTTPHDWMPAPPVLEDHYSVLDALAFAGLGMTLLNHADRVKIACLAQLVNVIAPIFTEKKGRVIRQSIYYPFQLLSRYGSAGTVLKPVCISPKAETQYGDVPVLHTSAVYDPQQGTVTVFALNIGKEPMELTLSLGSFGKVSMEQWICLKNENLHLKNTFESPEATAPVSMPCISGVFSETQLSVPGISWNVLRFRVQP